MKSTHTLTRLALASAAAVLFCSVPAVSAAPTDIHPPIPVRFSLKEAGFVTLVIEDATGHRVRNLIGDTFFAAGDHVIWWDGLDESGIVRGNPSFTYKVTGKLVDPGTYHVRGLIHKQVDLRYQMTVNCPGNPPWANEAGNGAWLADHTPQTSCLFLPDGSPYGKQPQMLLGSSVAEGGFSLAWVDLMGHKLYGSKAMGWQGAHALARDAGKNSRPGMSAYTVFYDEGSKKLQIIGLPTDGKPSLVFAYQPPPIAGDATHPAGPMAYTRDDTNHIGMAVYNGVCVVSLPPENKLLFVQTPDRAGAQGKLIGTVDLPSPAGLLVDDTGKLYAVTSNQVHRFDVDWTPGKLSNDQTIIGAAAGLEDAHKLATDGRGHLYVSDWGNSNQVKVFSLDGKLVRSIGKAGPLQVGPYDPNGMTQPNGIAISGDGHLWVAECSYLPKRCSIWSLDGTLLQDFIGPSPYAGGGILDPRDKTRFYFSPHSGCLEFKLDWDTGSYQLKNVLFRPGTGRLEILDKDKARQVPQFPVYVGNRLYMSNTYNENDGPGAAGIWQVRNGMAILVGAVGYIRSWSVVDDLVMKDNWLAGHLPEGVTLVPITFQGRAIPLFNRTSPDGKKERVNLMFAWSDKNNDERVSIDELTFTWAPYPAGAFVVGDGLTVTDNQGDQLTPTGFTDQGVPLFDCVDAKRLLKSEVEIGVATRQPVVGKDGWLVITGGPIEGFKNGERMWMYHSQWPTGMALGLSPKPTVPGQLLNTMELLGPAVTPTAGDAGDIWALDGDYGDIYLLTTDGLYVTQLFQDTRLAKSPYGPDPAVHNMLLNDCTLLAECYYPTITQTTDGAIYLQAGKNRSSIVRVDGLESVRRLPPTDLVVSKDMLTQAKAYFLAIEQNRPRVPGDDTLTVLLRGEAPTVDGKLDDWTGASWVDIDEHTRAALMISRDRLYAAYSTDYPFALANNPDSIQTLFKGGEALDLMLGTDPDADPNRGRPVPGDLRLTISRIKNKPVAVVYRAVVPGTANPVRYDSPVGSVTIDQVNDATAQVDLASVLRDEKQRFGVRHLAEFEFSIPLAALGLVADAAKVYRCDIGILRGRPGQTSDRIYWHNKATGQTADLPTEASLTPGLWGKVVIKRGGG